MVDSNKPHGLAANHSFIRLRLRSTNPIPLQKCYHSIESLSCTEMSIYIMPRARRQITHTPTFIRIGEVRRDSGSGLIGWIGAVATAVEPVVFAIDNGHRACVGGSRGVGEG